MKKPDLQDQLKKRIDAAAERILEDILSRRRWAVVTRDRLAAEIMTILEAEAPNISTRKAEK
jgi:hypothetical protein